MGAPQGSFGPVGLKFYTVLVLSVGMENPDDCEVDFTLSLTEEQAEQLYHELEEAIDKHEERKFTFTVDPFFAPIAVSQLEKQIDIE